MNTTLKPASTTTILAIDLGKYKSLACAHDEDSGEFRFTGFQTTRAELSLPLAREQPAVVIIEACLLAGWVVSLPPTAVRQWRSLIACRQVLVGQRIAVQNRIRALFVAQSLAIVPGVDQRMIQVQQIPPGIRFAGRGTDQQSLKGLAHGPFAILGSGDLKISSLFLSIRVRFLNPRVD